MPATRDAGLTAAKENRDHRCIVFLHVPKTAGRTLRSSLFLSFSEQDSIHVDALDKPLAEAMGEISLVRRERARLVWGHLPYGIHRYIPRPCEYVTVLREPISRVTSVYKYILRTEEHVLHRALIDGSISLEEYVDSDIDAGQTVNSQTRQLSGLQFEALGREALADAKEHLGNFLVVGITERFEETFALFRRSAKLRVPVYITTNVSPPFEPSKRAIDLIRERNQLDLELYNFALELFRHQISRHQTLFRSEVSVYRALRPFSRLAGGRGHTWLERLVHRG